MSYILDALKKSEEERKKGDVPGLQTYTPTTEASSGKKTWVVGVIVLITTNIIGLVLWAPWKAGEEASQESLHETAHEAVQVQPVSTAPLLVQPIRPERETLPSVVSAKPNIPPPPPPKTVIKPTIEATARPIAKPVAPSRSVYPVKTPPAVAVEKPAPKQEYRPKETPSAAYLPQLSELPQSIQVRIPDLTFSSHMYSSQDRFRSITINGKRLKEGRYYNEDLYVNEITEKGAIMGFEGTLFEVDVLGQWGN